MQVDLESMGATPPRLLEFVGESPHYPHASAAYELSEHAVYSISIT